MLITNATVVDEVTQFVVEESS